MERKLDSAAMNETLSNVVICDSMTVYVMLSVEMTGVVGSGRRNVEVS